MTFHGQVGTAQEHHFLLDLMGAIASTTPAATMNASVFAAFDRAASPSASVIQIQYAASAVPLYIRADIAQ